MLDKPLFKLFVAGNSFAKMSFKKSVSDQSQHGLNLPAQLKRTNQLWRCWQCSDVTWKLNNGRLCGNTAPRDCENGMGIIVSKNRKAAVCLRFASA
jgi:hypothetical protein